MAIFSFACGRRFARKIFPCIATPAPHASGGPVRWYAYLFLAAFLACSPFAVLADDATAAHPELPPSLSEETQANLAQGRADLALARLMKYERLYAGNPDFDYLLGIVALKANANTLALHALERVVLLRPERAGAWIDLAIAHARLGEIDTATTLLDHVEQSFAVPPALRTALDDARRQLLAERIAGGWHGNLWTILGFDSNANSGLSIDRLTLTPGGIPAVFEIAPEYRSRSDGFMQMGGTLHRSWDTNFAGSDGKLVLHLAGRLKTYGQEKDFDLADSGIFAGYQRPLFGGEGEWGASSQHIRMGGSPLLNVNLLQMSWGRPMTKDGRYADCYPKGALEKEYRNYPSRHYLDGEILWLGGQLTCSTGIGDFSLVLRAGADKPSDARPGGISQRKEMTLLHQQTLWGKLNAEFSLSLSVSEDAEGYSPMLDNYSHRHIDRRFGRVVIFWPLTAKVEGMAALEITRQKSNILLFDQNDDAISIGARYRF